MDLTNRVCKPYLDKLVIVFINDILIYSRSDEDHVEHLKLIQELQRNKQLCKILPNVNLGNEKLHFVEQPVEVMDRETEKLKRSHIPIVKV